VQSAISVPTTRIGEALVVAPAVVEDQEGAAVHRDLRQRALGYSVEVDVVVEDAVPFRVRPPQEQHHVHVVLQRGEQRARIAEVRVAKTGKVDDSQPVQVRAGKPRGDADMANGAERVVLPVPLPVVLGHIGADLVRRNTARRCGPDQVLVPGECLVVRAQVPVTAFAFRAVPAVSGRQFRQLASAEFPW